MKPKVLNLFVTVFTGMILFILGPVANTQDNQTSQYLIIEEMQEEYMKLIREVPRIAADYPEFQYQVIHDEDGKVEDVIVKGVDDKMDKKRLEVLIFDVAKVKERMTDLQVRAGIYYAPAQMAEPKIGWDNFYKDLYANMEYPEDAEEWGVSGNVFVEFVVDTEGEISNIIASADNMQHVVIERHVEDLENAAREAVLATSGDWEPGRLRDGTPVPSLVTVPVQFRLELHPGVPTWIF